MQSQHSNDFDEFDDEAESIDKSKESFKEQENEFSLFKK